MKPFSNDSREGTADAVALLDGLSGFEPGRFANHVENLQRGARIEA